MPQFTPEAQNNELNEIQQVLRQFGVEDINDISDSQRQAIMKKIEAMQGQQTSTPLESRVTRTVEPFTSGRYYFGTPQGGVSAVQTGTTPTKASPVQDDLRNYMRKELIKKEVGKMFEEPEQPVVVPEGYEVTGYNFEAGKYRPKFGKVSTYDKDTLDRATTLRKEFNSDKAYKDYQTIQRSVQGLEEAYVLATAPDAQSRIASDQALGVLFQKMLDPTSVVRESEYARTPEGAGVINRITAIMPQLSKGGLRLEDSDRLALVEMARKLLQGGTKTFNNHIKRYKNVAKSYDVPFDLIGGGIDIIGGDKEQTSTGQLTDEEAYREWQQLPPEMRQ